MKPSTSSLVLLALVALLGAGAGSAEAQVADSGAFFVRLGTDTIAVERYVRTPMLLKGEAVLRTPQTRMYKLNVTFRDDGGVSWYEVHNDPVAGVPNSAPIMRTLTTYVGDSAQIDTWVAAVQRSARRTAASADMIPLQLPFYSTYETALLRARKKAVSDSVTINMLSGGGPLPYQVTFMPGDTVTLFHPQAGTNRAIFKDGKLLSWSGEGTTFKVEVTRAKWADVDAFAKRFAHGDAAGRSFGALSPRDSVVDVQLGDGFMTVNYGRPSKRGRKVFGGIVPWDQVWRTGANAATGVEFTVPVLINGSFEVPAGKYTLWTIPDKKQWTLIINKQTGQWGTVYDSAQDLVRLPVRTESMAVPVETFAIDVQPKANREVVMTLTWDKTRVVVPILPK
jgi:hypothetical protein